MFVLRGSLFAGGSLLSWVLRDSYQHTKASFVQKEVSCPSIAIKTEELSVHAADLQVIQNDSRNNPPVDVATLGRQPPMEPRSGSSHGGLLT